MDKKGIVGMVCALGLTFASPWVLAQPGHGHGAGPGPGGAGAGPGPGGCPGMGAGPGMGGAGPGMGPGMMGMGAGAGGAMMDGMMGPGMMGPGMMGGMGMGMSSGMMGPGMDMTPGMGPGMMGGAGMLAQLNLTQDQQRKINSIHDTLRRQNWDLQGKILDEQARLRDLYAQEQPDPKKVGEAYGNIANLQRQMIEQQVQAHNQTQNVLTPEQRQQWSQLRRGGFGGPNVGGRGAMRR